VIIENIKGYDNVVRLRLGPSKNVQNVLTSLQECFDDCFQRGQKRFVVDLTGIEYPAASLIALLVETTSRARRMQGDVKIINLTTSARNNFATFSPISYLSLEADEQYALRDFEFTGTKSNGPNNKPEIEVTRVPLDQSGFNTVDIVENPLIENFSEPVPKKEKDPLAVKRVESKDLRVASETKNLYTICDFVTESAAKAGFSPKDVGKIKIAVYEACLNIIEHAYHSNPNNWIDVRVAFDHSRLLIDIKDYGFGFEGFSNKQYDVVEAMDDRKTGGFGMYIIRRSMDELEYVPDEQHGNLLRMIKYIPEN
jgi:serine/threonine-protein kinase RsbW